MNEQPIPIRRAADRGQLRGSVQYSPSVQLSSDLVILSDGQSTTAEAIRQLRTRLIAQHVERGGRTLAMCSPNAEAGCSFIAANLAVAFAQIGTRVLLVNADLRHSGFDVMFGEGSAGEGLLQHLSAAKSSGQFGAVEILPSLWVMPSGGTSGDAQELLSTEQFASLIDTSAREFDLTIIDTPPANRYADAQRIASVARYCVIVARSDRTYYRDVEELTGQLQADGVTIVGTVFNQH